jgi:simple sugar transport system permease protein
MGAGLAGALVGVLHGWLGSLKRVHDIAGGIGLMIFGTG